jgi:membrane protein implicated in regulation of membrane protease activity
MEPIRISPGPAAAHAFRLGIVVSAVVGLTGTGLLYWVGAITLPVTAFVLVVLFPVYLVLAAAVLSRWLGYDKDHTSLRPVYRPR